MLNTHPRRKKESSDFVLCVERHHYNAVYNKPCVSLQLVQPQQDQETLLSDGVPPHSSDRHLRDLLRELGLSWRGDELRDLRQLLASEVLRVEAGIPCR